MSTGTWDHGSFPKAIPDLMRGLRIRIAASAIVVVGGFVFDLLYLAFIASRFSWYQNLAVLVSSFVIVPVALVLLWVLWGLGVARRTYRASWD